MEIYEKEYEDVFDSERTKKKLKLERISVSGGMNHSEYARWCKENFKDIFNSFWLEHVKIFWMERMFMVDGRVRGTEHNSQFIDGMFSIFFRNTIGIGREIYSKSPAYTRFKTYFLEMYPWIQTLEGYNPFDNPEVFKFPYRNITPEFLLVVYQMEERNELLKIADEKEMNYGEFLDFIVNQALCVNDRLGREKYRLSFYNKCTHYIRNNDIKRNKDEADKSKKSFMKNKNKKHGEETKTSYFYNR